jgi:xanthine dehydrogenase YagT iron-sulfur-binding subunit
MSKQDDEIKSGVSRRDFLKISSVSAALPLVVGPKMVQAGGANVPVHGPGPVPITLTVNGKRYSAQLEPRVTLLDAMREQFDVTSPKRVCNRGECGACTVLVDGKAMYSCTMFAIEAQGKQITTAEGLGTPAHLDPVQAAFWNNDAEQCGFCTPGFVVATKAFLAKHPHATPEDIRLGLGGNLCRCGTYAGIKGVVADLTGRGKGGA